MFPGTLLNSGKLRADLGHPLRSQTLRARLPQIEQVNVGPDAQRAAPVEDHRLD